MLVCAFILKTQCIIILYSSAFYFTSRVAMYGYTPKGVDNNFKHYALYNACILDIEYEHNSKTDKKEPVKATFHDNLSIMKGFATHVLYMGVFMSIFSPILYEPYETEANGNEAGYDFAHLVDINLIPLSAVKRVEVLKEGASAIYGSDAIAGVVNIILWDDYEGLIALNRAWLSKLPRPIAERIAYKNAAKLFKRRISRDLIGKR